MARQRTREYELFEILKERFASEQRFNMDDVVASSDATTSRATLRVLVKRLTDSKALVRMHKNCYIIGKTPKRKYVKVGGPSRRQKGNGTDQKKIVTTEEIIKSDGFRHLFEGHYDVYDRLVEEAKLEFRTPLEQLRYFVWKGCWERKQVRDFKLKQYVEDKNAHEESKAKATTQ